MTAVSRFETKASLWRTAEETALAGATTIQETPAAPAAFASSTSSEARAAGVLDAEICRVWKDYRAAKELGHGPSILWTKIELRALLRVRKRAKRTLHEAGALPAEAAPEAAEGTGRGEERSAEPPGAVTAPPQPSTGSAS
jgi:hypothetical protein